MSLLYHPVCLSPFPTSPARGEVPHRVFGSISPNIPAQHLPLDGGGWEGVFPTLETNRRITP
jgi:hypothetical protein